MCISGPHQVYIIEVKVGDHSWTVKHRYSDFHDLHEKVSHVSKSQHGSDLWYRLCVYSSLWVTDKMFDFCRPQLTAEKKIDKHLLPPKKIIGKNSKSLVEKRQKELEVYLQTLLNRFPSATPKVLSNFLHYHLYVSVFKEQKIVMMRLQNSFCVINWLYINCSLNVLWAHEETPKLHACSSFIAP